MREASPSKGEPGILHHYAGNLVTFEYTSGANRKPNSLLFIGGLGDGLATVEYMADIVAALRSTSWSLFSVTLSSSYGAWGLGHLNRDIEEIAKCAKYVEEYKTAQFGPGKLVIMGHSTGSQDILHYLHRPNPQPNDAGCDLGLEYLVRPTIDGAILQASVSDRQGILSVVNDGTHRDSPAAMRDLYDQMTKMAKEATSDKQNSVETILPLSMTTRFYYPASAPVGARRWLSLASPESPSKPSHEDMFSSDLSDEQLQQTFGMIGARGLLRSKLLILFSGRDQSVPASVNKEQLLARWKQAANQGSKDEVWDGEYSGVIPGASHALSDPDQAEPRKDLLRRVMGFLSKIERN